MSNEETNFEGWHARAKPHSDPHSFVPVRSSLAFAVTHSAPARPHGFTLAAFSPNVLVDASGHVLNLTPEDFAGLVSLAQQTVDLPSTGSFMNAWRVAQPRTSQPIERLFVVGQDGRLVETSVQGYEKGKTELQAPVGNIDHLPPLLYELFGLIAEAREGYEMGQEDSTVIAKVRAVLQEQ